MSLQTFRNVFYLSRQRLKYFILSRFVTRKRLNMDYWRLSSDIPIFYPLYLPKRYQRIYFRRKVSWYKRRFSEGNINSIFIEIEIVDLLEEFLRDTFHDFSGIFIINPMDRTMKDRPAWMGVSARWASPNIEFPKESDGVLIPLGIEDLKRGKNGNPWNFIKFSKKYPKILVGPFGQTHSARHMFNLWNPSQTVSIYKSRINAFKYSRLASRHGFILCPRGNGIDTHRFWEALYRDCIPIVKNSAWAHYWNELGLPVLIVEEYEDIFQYTEDQLRELYLKNSKKFSESNFLLEVDFWRERLMLR